MKGNKISNPQSVENITVKDIELTGSMFDTVPEDMFFILD
jgi:hypothetical protein